MSVQATSVLRQAREWMINNPKEIAFYSMVSAVALFMIGLGALVPAMDMGHNQYFDGNVKDANDYLIAFIVITGAVGGIGGLVSTIVSIAAYVLSRRQNTKRIENVTPEEVRSQVRKKSLCNLAIAIGCIALFFGAGMILGSSLLKEHVISVIKNTHDPWYGNRLWLVQASQLVDGLISAGVFSTIGGGSLLLFCGGADWLRQKFKGNRLNDNTRIDDAVKV